MRSLFGKCKQFRTLQQAPPRHLFPSWQSG
jgi:hypothetical protein